MSAAKKSILKVLLVEDNPGDVRLIRVILAEDSDGDQFDLTFANRLSTAVEMLTTENPDAVLLDLSLPDSQGLGTVISVVAQVPGIPIIVLTGMDDEALAVKALKEGAQDYLVKNQLDSTLLPRTIRYAIERKQVEDALQASEQRFRTLVEKSTDEIVLLDAEFKPTYASPSVARASGYSPEELAEFDRFATIHPEDADSIQNIYAQLQSDPEQPQLFQVRLQRKDGTWRWVEGVATNLLKDPSVGGILFNYHDITERKQHIRELEIIAIASAALRAAPTRSEIFSATIDQLLNLLEIDAASLAIREPASEETLIERAGGTWATQTGQRFQPGKGIAGHVIHSGQAYLNNDMRSDPLLYQPDQLGDLNAVAAIPLIAEGHTIGALCIGRKKQIEAAEIRLLTSIGDVAANAIHRATLHEQTEQRLKHIAALRTIDKAISSSFDLQFTLNIMLDQVTTRLGVDAADVLLLDPYSNILEFGAGHGFRAGPDKRSQLWLEELSEGQAARVALEQRIVSIPNFAESDEPFTHAKILEGEDFMAYYGVPLISKGHVKGVLEVFHRKPLKPDPEWLDFLETLAGQAAIAIDNTELFDGLQRSNLELRLAYDATIEGWSHALDLRDKETEGHTLRVTETTMKLARAMGLSESELIHLRRGALLHDIGKMGVPDNILLKPDKLTDEEWVIMRKHPTYAYEMLSPIQFLRPALDIPYCHHEKWDGTGYPRGLREDEIPLVARIFAIVDIWDALRSDRPYRPAWPEEKVLDYIQSLSGNHLDPQVLNPFMEVNKKL